MKILSNIIWFALGMIVVTGIGLFIPKSEVLLASSKFLLKLSAIAVLIINGVFLNLLISPKLMEITFEEVKDHKFTQLHILRKLSFALGAISITSWYLVFILGLLSTIPLPFGKAFTLYILFLCFAIVISQIFEQHIVRNFEKQHKGDISKTPGL
jgi:hypothetical protein